MAIYSISYDLHNKDSKNYSNLYQAIQSYGDYCRPLESTWLISTTDNASEITRNLMRFICPDDKFLVILSVVPNCDGCIAPEIQNWLRAHNHF